MAPIKNVQGDFAIDQAIVDGRYCSKPAYAEHVLTVMLVMPKGTSVISAEEWNLSAWTRIAKINTVLADGSPKRYFLKVFIHTHTHTQGTAETCDEMRLT